MKRAVVVIAAIAIVLGAAYYFTRNRDNGPKYSTEKVIRGGVEAAVSATGTVSAVTTVLVGSQVSGTIQSIYADFNSRVRKGQLIAQIDPAIFQAQVAQAKANLASAEADVDAAKAGHKEALSALERGRRLHGQGLLTDSSLDAAVAANDTALFAVTAAQARVSQMRAALDMALMNLEHTRIKSPVDGTVVSRGVEVGQTVASSFQTPTLFTIAEDLTKMQVNCSVAEADIGRVKPGQEVSFTVDAYPDVVFKGNVSEIRISPTVEQNVVTYNVVTNVDNKDMLLLPGMTANASIVHSRKEGVLLVKVRALRFYPDRSGSLPPEKSGAPGMRPQKPGVWVMKDGAIERVEVVEGISSGTFTEVSSPLLAEGVEVVVDAAGSGRAQEKQTGFRIF